jgi:hypothetical protein
MTDLEAPPFDPPIDWSPAEDRDRHDADILIDDGILAPSPPAGWDESCPHCRTVWSQRQGRWWFLRCRGCDDMVRWDADDADRATTEAEVPAPRAGDPFDLRCQVCNRLVPVGPYCGRCERDQ